MPSLVILLCVSGVYLRKWLLFEVFSILLLFNIVFHLATWSIAMKTIRWWCVSYTNTHTLQTSRVWQCPIWGGCHLLVGREHVTSYLTQRCGKMGWGVGGSGLCCFPWGCCPLSWPLYSHRFSPAYQGHTITTNFHSLSQSGAVISLCAIWSCNWLLTHLFTNQLVLIFRLMAPLFCR